MKQQGLWFISFADCGFLSLHLWSPVIITVAAEDRIYWMVMEDSGIKITTVRILHGLTVGSIFLRKPLARPFHPCSPQHPCLLGDGELVLHSLWLQCHH